MRDYGGRQSGMLGQGADGQGSGDPDAQLSSEQLVEQEDLAPIERVPELDHGAPLLLLGSVPQRQ